MNEVENVVNYVGNEETNLVGNDQVKFVGDGQIDNMYTQNSNKSNTDPIPSIEHFSEPIKSKSSTEPIPSIEHFSEPIKSKSNTKPIPSIEHFSEPIKSSKTFTGCETDIKISNEVKLNSELSDKSSGRIHTSISVSQQTSSGNTVPGIEFLLHNDMRNAGTIGIVTTQSFPQLPKTERTENPSIGIVTTQSFHQLQKSERTENASIGNITTQRFHPSVKSERTENNESAQKFNQLSKDLEPNDQINDSAQNYGKLHNSEQPGKFNEPIQTFQHVRNPRRIEKLEESSQNYQPLENSGRNEKFTESIQTYPQVKQEANKFSESVSNFQRFSNSQQIDRLNETVQTFGQLHRSQQTNKLNETPQNYQLVGNSQQAMKSDVSTRNYQRLESPGQREKANHPGPNYQSHGNAEQANKLLDTSQRYQQLANTLLASESNLSGQNNQGLDGNPGENDKLNETVQNYQQLKTSHGTDNDNKTAQNDQLAVNSAQAETTNLAVDVKPSVETSKPSISSTQINPNNAVPTTLNRSLQTVTTKGLSVPRKTVGIRGPIAMRETVSTMNNVPGIEYLLHNDLRNPSMINPAYLRSSEHLRNQQINNGAFNTNMVAVSRREPMVTSMFNNPTNVVVVDRSADTTTVSRELSVPRKPVGIREPIVMRESMTTTNSVPGIEYLLHNDVSTDNLGKKSRPPKEERPFLCTTCGNKFRQQSHLQQHIRIHTNHRPYQCSFCEKAFKQKSQLNQHERIHTGEKPYKCGICEKAFAQAGQLYSHRKTHGLNINEIKTSRDGRDQTTPRKRGRRAKVEGIPTAEVGSPPFIFIMDPHPRQQRPVSHFQFPRPFNDFRPHLFNNGDRYSGEKLPKIETVVSLGPRARMPAPPSPNSSTATNTTTTPQLYYWKHDTSKESQPGT